MKDHLVSMLLKDHQPVEFQCVSEKAKIEIGNIYTGIVKNVVKNINGAFVEFDEDEMGFLSMQHKQYKAGDEVLVQIKKEATKEKRPMLSDQIELTGKYLVLTSDKLSVGISNKIHKKDKKQELREMAEPLVTQEYGFIIRTEAAKADKEDVLYEADMLAEKYQQIVRKKSYRKAPQLVDTNYDALSVLVCDIKPEAADSIVTDQEDLYEQLKEKGYELEIKEYVDYIQPNLALESGDLDANYFQHLPYLESFNKENGTNLVSAGAIHYEPFGVYAGKTTSLDELQDGATIAVPNDTTNEARALLLLEAQGLIKLKEDAGLTATKNDIVENPKNLQLYEVEAAQLPRVIGDVDVAVINGNYAIEAGYKVSDALAVEASDSLAATTYGNVVAVRAGEENDPAIQALIEALTSDEVKAFIESTYDGAVVPLF